MRNRHYVIHVHYVKSRQQFLLDIFRHPNHFFERCLRFSHGHIIKRKPKLPLKKIIHKSDYIVLLNTDAVTCCKLCKNARSNLILYYEQVHIIFIMAQEGLATVQSKRKIHEK